MAEFPDDFQEIGRDLLGSDSVMVNKGRADAHRFVSLIASSGEWEEQADIQPDEVDFTGFSTASLTKGFWSKTGKWVEFVGELYVEPAGEVAVHVPLVPPVAGAFAGGSNAPVGIGLSVASGDICRLFTFSGYRLAVNFNAQSTDGVWFNIIGKYLLAGSS